jgi:hypothetical protein
VLPGLLELLALLRPFRLLPVLLVLLELLHP